MLERLLNISEIPGSIFSVKREKASKGRQEEEGSERRETGEREKEMEKWRNGLVVKSASCSCRGPEFCS